MKNCTIFEFSSVKLYLFHHNVTKYDLGLGCNQEHSTETWKSQVTGDLDLEPFLLQAQDSYSTYGSVVDECVDERGLRTAATLRPHQLKPHPEVVRSPLGLVGLSRCGHVQPETTASLCLGVSSSLVPQC